MDEISIRRAADKVMCYTNNNFVVKFDEVKDLLEEVYSHCCQEMILKTLK